jgi:hypothetical protein
LDVRTTVPPSQKEVSPPAIIIGVAGAEFTAMVVVSEVALHPLPSVKVTVYPPAVVASMDWEFIPLDHMLPVGLLEVRVTLSPWQIVVEPPTVMVGVAGRALTVI